MKKNLLFFALVITILLAGCKKKDLPDPKETETPATITSQFYFKGNIDGKEVVYEDGKDSYANGALNTGSYNSAGKFEEAWTTIRKYTSSENSMSVGMRKFFNGGAPDCQNELAMISVGSSSYSFNDSDGAIVMYTDEQGKMWYSYLGSQTGNIFEVTEYIDNAAGSSNKIVKIKFSAKLYDEDGNSKSLTNGEIRGRIFYCL